MTMPGRLAGPARVAHTCAAIVAPSRGGEKHRLGEAVALRHPVVEAGVAGAAVLAPYAEVGLELAQQPERDCGRDRGGGEAWHVADTPAPMRSGSCHSLRSACVKPGASC